MATSFRSLRDARLQFIDIRSAPALALRIDIGAAPGREGHISQFRLADSRRILCLTCVVNMCFVYQGRDFFDEVVRVSVNGAIPDFAVRAPSLS